MNKISRAIMEIQRISRSGKAGDDMSINKHVLAGYVMPHPPVIVPGVSREPHLAARTMRAMEDVGREIAAIKPDTVIVVSPHAPMFSDYIFFYQSAVLEGSLSRFGAPQSKISYREDSSLRRKITELLEAENIAAGGLDSAQMGRFGLTAELDHGVVVPLYFLPREIDCRIVAMSSSDLPLDQLYLAGKIIRQACAEKNKRVVIIASGDQSHMVNQKSPYGCCAEGAEYDQAICSGFRETKLTEMLNIDFTVRKKAAECGYRSIVITLGAFDSQPVKTELLSYEAPYGIGYCVAAIRQDTDKTEIIPGAMEKVQTMQREKIARDREKESFPVQVARRTLESEIKQKRRLKADDFLNFRSEYAAYFQNRAGVFVSVHKNGELRGCIGTTSATTESIVSEIIQNAISAGIRDPRFSPVTVKELPDIIYSVDILGATKPVKSKGELDPQKYGVIVRHGPRSGLLLPALDGVDTIEQQLEIACRKAGISSDTDYQIQKFEVTRYT